MRKQLDSEVVTILKWHTQEDQRRMTETISPIMMTLSNQSIQSILPRKARRRKYD